MKKNYFVLDFLQDRKLILFGRFIIKINLTSPLNSDKMILERRNKMAKQKQNTQRINVFLPPELLEDLQQEADLKGTNVSALIRMILMERKNSK